MYAKARPDPNKKEDPRPPEPRPRDDWERPQHDPNDYGPIGGRR